MRLALTVLFAAFCIGPVAHAQTVEELMERADEARRFFDNPLVEDGLYIRYLDDGSGHVALAPEPGALAWDFKCQPDAMTDRQMCNFSGLGLGGIFVDYGGTSAPQTVCALGHDFPGRTAMFRIDKNPPITSDEDGCVPTGKILIQLMNGGSVTIRWFEFPYDYPKDTKTGLHGFRKVIDVVGRVILGKLQPTGHISG